MSINVKQITPILCIKSYTADGDKAKQYFQVFTMEDGDKSLLIIKRILTKDIGILDYNFRIVKKYKDYILVEKWFSFRISTLNTLFSFLREYKLIK